MKRIVLTLTDDEYRNLEHHAKQERRTVRDMAAYLVAKNTPEAQSVGTLTFTNRGNLVIPNSINAAAPSYFPQFTTNSTTLDARGPDA